MQRSPRSSGWVNGMLAVLCVAGCGSSTSGSGTPDAGGGDDAGTAALQWWSTCGDLICLKHRDAGIPACTTEMLHDRCTESGAQCDPGDRCNTHLICSDQDPRPSVGCPISRASAKTEVSFLAPAELRAYRDEILALPLATFRYRGGGAASRLHLGFLIDGHESLACVDPERDQVDLYGYASMAVAALQVQAREIEELTKEVAALKAEVKAYQPTGAGGSRARSRKSE